MNITKIFLIIIIFTTAGNLYAEDESVDISDILMEYLEEEYDEELKKERFEVLKGYVRERMQISRKLDALEENIEEEIEGRLEQVKDDYYAERKKLYQRYKSEKAKISRSFDDEYDKLEDEYDRKKDEAYDRYKSEKKSLGKDQAKINYKLEKAKLKEEFRVKEEAIKEEEEIYEKQKDLLFDQFFDTWMEIRSQRKMVEKDIEKAMEEAIEKEKGINDSKKEVAKLGYKDAKEQLKVKLALEVEAKISEMQQILNNLDPVALTFVTNGTRLSRKYPVDSYFLVGPGTMDSQGYADLVAEYLGSPKGYFIGWKGANNSEARIEAAILIYNKIRLIVSEEALASGIKPHDFPINLAGHSHGGNVMIMVCNLLQDEGFNVQFLFTLGTPGREYRIKKEVQHLQIYSYEDTYMKIGGWDFEVLFFDLRFGQKTDKLFENAINLNTSFFIDEELYRLYQEDWVELHSDSNMQHQLLRYAGTIKEILSGNTVLSSSSETINTP
jgi:hypothetical protein